MGCLSQFGKLGLTSIGDSPQEAEDIYNKVIEVLDLETSGDHNYAISADYNFPMTGDGYSC
jgi:hypothetical protein